MNSQISTLGEMKAIGDECRAAYQVIKARLGNSDKEVLKLRQAEAEHLFRRISITFAVNGKADAEERLIPFDIIPRVLTRSEWQRVTEGLNQRVEALNLFLKDIYSKADVIKTGIIPADLIYQNPYYRLEMLGNPVAHDIDIQIAGIDLVRVDSETFYILEDNARTPSGVSYMLENREVMMRLCPDLFSEHQIAPVDNYPDELLATLRSLAPRTSSSEPNVVLLTPGQFNSAKYEHSFLAEKMGIELVEGCYLFVRENIV